MANGYYDYMWGNTQNQNQNFNPSSFAGIGRFDPNNLVNIRNRYQQSNQLMDPTLMMNQLGNVPQAIGGTDIDMQYTTGNEFNIPPRRNILSRFGSGVRNVAGDLVGGASNIYNRAKDKFSGIPSVIGGAISALAPRFSGEGKYSEKFPAREFTEQTSEGPRTYTQQSLGGHYTPYEKDVMESYGQVGEYGDPRKDVFGQNIVSFAEDHEEKLRDWVRKYGSRKSDDPRFNKRQRQKNALLQRIDERKGDTRTGDTVDTGGRGYSPEKHYNPTTQRYQAPAEHRAERSFTYRDPNTGREKTGFRGGRAEGGRIGYRDGEFVDEDVNIQGPGFDVNENIEMAEEDPFRMRIQELIDKGLSWEDAYDIAAHEFQDEFAEGPEESFSEDQGIASLV